MNWTATDGAREYAVTARPVQTQRGSWGRSIRFAVWVDQVQAGELRLVECFGESSAVTICNGQTKAGIDVPWLVSTFRDTLKRYPKRTTGPGA